MIIYLSPLYRFFMPFVDLDVTVQERQIRGIPNAESQRRLYLNRILDHNLVGGSRGDGV